MRSKLFVPGSRPELFAKAHAGQADAISIDLEDAVAEPRKADARAAVAAWLDRRDRAADAKTLIVRANAPSTPHFEADLDAIVRPGLDMLNLSMIDSAEDVQRAIALIAARERRMGLDQPIALLVNIETPRGLRNAASIAAVDDRVTGLQLGLGDLFEPLGIDRNNPTAVQHVQLHLRLAAGETGRWVFDAAFADIADSDGFARECEAARRLGFLGKSCIHPSQIPIANRIFRPSDVEIAHASKVLAAADRNDGVGAFVVDGRMIDAPFIRRAEAVMAIATRLGLLLRDDEDRSS